MLAKHFCSQFLSDLKKWDGLFDAKTVKDKVINFETVKQFLLIQCSQCHLSVLRFGKNELKIDSSIIFSTK